MPTLEAVEYEHFDFSEPDVRPLGLDEAIRRATELKAKESRKFYRVEPVNASGTGFRVKEVSSGQLYAEFMERISHTMGRYMRRRR